MFGRVLAAVASIGALAIWAISSHDRADDAITLADNAPVPSPEMADAGSETGPRGLPVPFSALRWLHSPKAPPEPGDWLSENEEPGQTYREWLDVSPVRATPERGTIYFLPVGDFSRAQEEIVDLTKDYASRFFSLPVRALPPLDADVIPAQARRANPHGGHPQVLAPYFLHLLVERRPDDAIAVIAFTPEDLFPATSWNFVYGMAWFEQRVGVYSLSRLGNPAKSRRAFEATLRRTLLTAMHELGHMFSVMHCTRYECVMNGVNHDEEAESRPLEPCPEDLAKICAATGCDPARRFESLREFWLERGTAPELVDYLARAKELASPSTALR